MAYLAALLAAMVLLHVRVMAQEDPERAQDTPAVTYSHVDVHSFELPLRLDSLITEPTGTSRDPQWTFVIQLTDPERRVLAKSVPLRREWGSSMSMKGSFPVPIALKFTERYRFFVIMVDATGNTPERIAGATPEFRPQDFMAPVPPSLIELPNMRGQLLLTLNVTWN